MRILSEFKEFISTGSVLDLTVGVITGAAFSKVVSSFTDDIVMPSLALLKNSARSVPGLDKVNPDALAGTVKLPIVATGASAAAAHTVVVAAPASGSEGLASIGFGNFVSAIIYFLIISLIILMVVKVANRFRKPVEVEIINESLLSKEEMLLTEIRDALRARS